MEVEWVDFKVIKSAVTMRMVLDRYGIVLKQTGGELRGKCPIHRGSNNKHFTANLNKNVFKCFFAKCGAHGNVLDFVAAMEQCSVREAAVKLKDWFTIGELAEIPDVKNVYSVQHGIYQDHGGKLYEVIGSAVQLEDLDVRVVYRELFGEYRLCVGPLQLVKRTEALFVPFVLVKAL